MGSPSRTTEESVATCSGRAAGWSSSGTGVGGAGWSGRAVDWSSSGSCVGGAGCPGQEDLAGVG